MAVLEYICPNAEPVLARYDGALRLECDLHIRAHVVVHFTEASKQLNDAILLAPGLTTVT